MSEQQPLSAEARESLARRLLDVQLAVTEPANEPRALLTAGQPGSGKSVIVRSMSVQFDNREGAVVIDPDAIRPNVDYMKERIAKGDLTIPDAAYQDAGTIAAMMMKMATEERRHIIYDGTLSNSHYAGQNAEHLRASRYQVEIHAMAVDPDLSHARTYNRREIEIAVSPTHFGRGVGDAFHDQAVKGLVDTVRTLQDAGKVDAIVLYDRTGKEVGSARLEDGRWVPNKSMADELSKAHSKPDEQSRAEAARTWESAAELMRTRGADAGEQRRVDAFRDASRAQVAPVAQPDADKLASLPSRDPSTGPLTTMSVAKASAELERYMPHARLEATERLRGLAKADAPAAQLDAARAELGYVTHPKGPAYQAQLLGQLGARNVEAVITREQTPLARVRELGAAIGDQLAKQEPGRIQRAMQVLEKPAPAATQEVARGPVAPALTERIREPGRGR